MCGINREDKSEESWDDFIPRYYREEKEKKERQLLFNFEEDQDAKK